MKKDILKKFKKDTVLKNELRRAHIMIVLLALCVVLLAALNTLVGVELSSLLATCLIVLSLIVMAISTAVVVRLAGK